MYCGNWGNGTQGLFEVPKPEFDLATFSMSRERKKSRVSSWKHDMSTSVPQEFGAGLGPSLMDLGRSEQQIRNTWKVLKCGAGE